MYRSPRIVLLCFISLSVLLISGCDYWVSDATRLERAAQAKSVGDYGLASVELRNVLQSDPDHLQARMELVDVLLLNGESSAAQNFGESLWQEVGNDERVAEMRVRMELANGNAEKLLEALETDAFALPPARLALARGQAQLALGNLGVAEEEFQRTLTVDPNVEEARIGLAQVFAMRQEFERALSELMPLSKADSSNPRALRLRGMILSSLGESVAALSTLKLAHKHAGGHLTRAELTSVLVASIEQHLALGQVTEAEATQTLLVKNEPAAILTIFSRAQIAAAKNDYAAAATELQALLVKQPGLIQARSLLAKVLYAQERWEQAEQQALQVVGEQPQHVDARILLARIYLRDHRAAKAIEFLAPVSGTPRLDLSALMLESQQSAARSATSLTELSSLVARKPSDEALRTIVAATYLRAGDVDAALNLLRQETGIGSSVNPQRVNLILAAVASRTGIAGAQREAERLAAQSSADGKTFLAIGRFFAMTRQGEQALLWLQRAADREPNNVPIQVEFARMALASGDLAGAERVLERLLRVNADNLDAQLLLAECAARRGDSNKALRYLSTARTKHPWAVQPMLAMASLHIQTGSMSAAEFELRSARVLATERAGSLAEIARLWSAAKRFDDAADVLKAATTLQPNNGQLWGRLSEAELARGEAEAALGAAQKAFAVQADAASLRLLVQASGKLDQASSALKIVRDFRATHPQDIDAAVLEGDALMLAHEYSEASRIFDGLLAQFTEVRPRGSTDSQSASNSDPNTIVTGSLLAVKASQARREGELPEPNAPLLTWLKLYDVPVARLALADGYRTDGDFPSAITNYQQVLARSPDNITALNNLAVTYFEAKDPRALETARKAYTLQSRLAAVADTYGWILLHAGLPAEALPVLKAAAADGQSAEIEYHYAVALARTGKSSEALGLLKKILALSADFPGKADAEQLFKQLQAVGAG